MLNKIRSAFTLFELLVAMFIVSILICVLLNAVQNARNLADKMICQNRLKQLGIGLLLYHETNSVFPPGHRSLPGPQFGRFTGWTCNILPYVDELYLQNEAIKAFSLQPKPFLSPPHPINISVPAFTCASDPRVRIPQVAKISNIQVGLLSYLGVSGTNFELKNGILFQDSNIKISEIGDGTSNTLLLGERPPSENFQFGWWYAGTGQNRTGSCDLILGMKEPNLLPIVPGSPCGPGTYSFGDSKFSDPCGKFHFWSPHSSGAHFLFADGSVRFFTYDSKNILESLATRSGND